MDCRWLLEGCGGHGPMIVLEPLEGLLRGFVLVVLEEDIRTFVHMIRVVGAKSS